TVSWDGLRELAGFRAEKGCAISVYVDLDPSVAPTAGDAASRVNSLMHEGEVRAESAHELTHEQREALRADLVRIRDFFQRDFDRDGSRGVAVFCAGLDNAWRTLPLGDPVADKIAVGREFYLSPLVPLVGRGDGALIAVVGRERGTVYILRAGRLEELVDQFDEAPGRHDQGGWSQARYQRHIETLVHEHLKEVAEQLDRRVRRLRSPRDRRLGRHPRSSLRRASRAPALPGRSRALGLAVPALRAGQRRGRTLSARRNADGGA